MALTLGIDIGTYQAKGVIADETGRIVVQASRDHRMQVPRPGWAEHDAEADWWGGFVALCREMLRDVEARDIACVATSAIGPCMLPVDAEGRALCNAVLYGVDTRAAEEIEALTREIGSDRILETCGNALTSQSVGPKILWLQRHHPEIYARAAKIVTSTSFLVQRLTGACVIDHYTAANFSPLYDVNRLDWTDALAGFLPLDKLPRLAWSTEIAGQVSAAAAAATGLMEGTPVTVGTIDAAAEAVSVGTRAAGDMMMMYGSTIFMIQVTERPVRDGRLWYAPWLYPGRHASMAGLATSGTLTHWFRDQFARELPKESAFATLAAEAEASPPGANGLILLPYFSGERTPIHDPHAKGTVIGLNLTHRRGDLYRALIEGIAMGTAHVIETCREIGAAPARLLAVGGGTQNALWVQATSDFADLPQIVSAVSTGAAYGNAFLAACAVGLAKEEDIAAWNPPAREIRPERSAVHAAHYALFRRLYEQTKEIGQALDG